MAKRLTENHPLMKKLRALEKFMGETGISLEWDGYHMKAIDGETGISAFIRDVDSGEETPEVPHMFETKLIIED